MSDLFILGCTVDMSFALKGKDREKSQRGGRKNSSLKNPVIQLRDCRKCPHSESEEDNFIKVPLRSRCRTVAGITHRCCQPGELWPQAGPEQPQ